ncbi:ABC-type transporter Mla maintaining outer membrane lipid asymmetry, MlaC component [Colwellia chukchiensis]|uniref:ABC-type transporter Mla maintaining outer membrane lipid asymmetry, MlaC component n=1 Tax=Colwellia chukchiensis TaxID=641665 RepID=A0A1H7NUI7_9GAMM|nr:ABC transporter substrate-binding protein [Colwellia chukchiensis]SEL27310.1 ABC-type transporter Mla maintaining outer membrane lipid asymmetry, MlaC component [Colwellia chukchiensis]
MKIKFVLLNNLVHVVFFTLALLVSASVFADAESAKNKVTSVFTQVESSLVALKRQQALTKTNIRAVLEQYLLPEVEARYFTYKVLNKNLAKVPDALRADFTHELSVQLINTYSNLLTKYNNETLTIGTSTLSNSGKLAMVNITIEGKTTTNNAVVKLLRSNTNDWLFFDIEIEGISLLQTKQGEINASFSRLGVEGTLAHLKKINANAVSD